MKQEGSGISSILFLPSEEMPLAIKMKESEIIKTL
jgi:hypothetical protein